VTLVTKLDLYSYDFYYGLQIWILPSSYLQLVLYALLFQFAPDLHGNFKLGCCFLLVLEKLLIYPLGMVAGAIILEHTFETNFHHFDTN